MNRAILNLILSGTSILIAHLFFFFLPISIFPCIISIQGHESVQSLCSVAEVTNTRMFASAYFTGYGELVHFLATWPAPIVLSIAFVLSTSGRTRSRKRSSSEELP